MLPAYWTNAVHANSDATAAAHRPAQMNQTRRIGVPSGSGETMTPVRRRRPHESGVDAMRRAPAPERASPIGDDVMSPIAGSVARRSRRAHLRTEGATRDRSLGTRPARLLRLI